MLDLLVIMAPSRCLGPLLTIDFQITFLILIHVSRGLFRRATRFSHGPLGFTRILDEPVGQNTSTS